MPLTLQLVNETTLPDGGPVSFQLSGKCAIDIGRAAHLDWTLPDPTRFISNKHCEIRYKNGGYWLRDVSTNGISLNGADHRMQAPHRLRHGDRFTVGRYLVTFEHAKTSFAWRELDIVRVQGRDEPVTIYEPLARHAEETPQQKTLLAAYRHALACWRSRDFAGCAKALTPLAAADPPSAILLQRAKTFLAHPPAADWDTINSLEGK